MTGPTSSRFSGFTSGWMYEQWSRLAGMHPDEKIERDLARLFADYLNDQFHLSLVCTSKPDEDEHNKPAPDFAYTDEAKHVSVAFEVTRLYGERQRKDEEAWRRFSSSVEKKLSLSVRNRYYYLVIGEKLRVPKDADVCRAVAAELAKMEPGDRVDLSLILDGPLKAGRLPQPCSRVVVESIVRRPTVNFASKYADNLKEANVKLRDWRSKGYETFLLYDARMLNALFSEELEQFKDWHDTAYQCHKDGLADPREDGPCPFIYKDFDNIDHVAAIALVPSGVSVMSIWQRQQCRLPFPCDKRFFKPPGWHDD